ncbi:hypothetical protein JBE27_30195 [Streptomyces albiflaviniger]|nr:hypothetical protein [Streptomyces albiflaviniger]
MHRHLHHLAPGTVDLTRQPRYGERRHPAAHAWLDTQVREECAMEQYAAFYRDWHDFFGSYTWQKLGGGHRAGGTGDRSSTPAKRPSVSGTGTGVWPARVAAPPPAAPAAPPPATPPTLTAHAVTPQAHFRTRNG